MKKTAIAACMLFAPVALADGYGDLNSGIQLRNRGMWEQAVPYFDKALADGDLTPDQKLVALLDRGEAHGRLDHADLALADFTAALTLQPTSAYALLNRAGIYEFQKKYDLALADLDALATARPLLASTYRLRARVNALRGQLDKSRDDLRLLLSLMPDKAQGRGIGIIDWQLGLMPEAGRNMSYTLDHEHDIYSWIWLALVDMRTGKDVPRRDLPDYVKTKWPAPIVGYFLGDTPQDQVFELARTMDGGQGGANGRDCEANFYVGERLLQLHDTTGAAPLIHKAANECPRNFVEWSPAQIDQAELP